MTKQYVNKKAGVKSPGTAKSQRKEKSKMK
jgi:hypothetical protein